MNPFFSIVIATYNRADLISRALRSLVSQTEQDWEALIIDDGSTDDTGIRIRPFLVKYRNMKYFRRRHRGMVPAKNAGIKASSGRYITFLDSDDEYHPDHLRLRKDILTQNPLVQFLYGMVTIIGNPYVPDRFDTSRTIHLDNCAIGGNFFIEAGTLKKLKGFGNLAFGVDADLFDRAAAAGLNMMKTDTPTYIYHHDTAGSITNKMMLQIV